jgi:hypothetical protein
VRRGKQGREQINEKKGREGEKKIFGWLFTTVSPKRELRGVLW